MVKHENKISDPNSVTWHPLSKLFHWIMAALILVLLMLGLYMTRGGISVMDQFKLTQLHKSLGFIAFSMVLLRWVWRLFGQKKVPVQEGLSSFEKYGAASMHFLLYVLMFLIPVSGWLMASASTAQDVLSIENSVFGLFNLYDPFVPGDSRIKELFATIHTWSIYVLIVCLAGHIAASLWHHFFLKDAVLRKMLWK